MGELELPERGFLQSRRGTIVEVALSRDPTGPLRVYMFVPDGAGEIPAGLHSTAVAAHVDDLEAGWMLAVELEPEEPDAPVRRDPVFDARWEWDDTDLVIAEHREDLELDDAPDLECDADPFGIWALDEQGRAFLITGGVDDDTGLLWLQPVSLFGSATHPGIYDAVVPADTTDAVSVDDDDVMVVGDTAQQLQVYLFDGYPDEPYQQWTIGTRAAIEAAAPHPLPDFDPTDWMRWLTPVDGGDAVPVVIGTADGALTFEVLGAKPPAWAQGRVISAPLPRGGQRHADRREVQITAKPVAELRSSNAKMRKRPPARVGRFVLEAEGFMPDGWTSFG